MEKVTNASSFCLPFSAKEKVSGRTKQSYFNGKYYFSKGKGIVIVGSLQNRSWVDRNGQKHYITEVIADECYFAGSKSDGEAVAPTANAASIPSAVTGNQSGTVQGAINDMAAGFEVLDTDEDLPF